jgi:hypothetical protein
VGSLSTHSGHLEHSQWVLCALTMGTLSAHTRHYEHYSRRVLFSTHSWYSQWVQGVLIDSHHSQGHFAYSLGVLGAVTWGTSSSQHLTEGRKVGPDGASLPFEYRPHLLAVLRAVLGRRCRRSSLRRCATPKLRECQHCSYPENWSETYA